MSSTRAARAAPGVPRRPVMPIHAAVPGRARLKVFGLYGNARLKRELESALASHGELQCVEASLLTGNLLVRYDVSRPLPRVLALMNQVVLRLPGLPEREALPPWRRPPRAAAKHLLPRRGRAKPGAAWHTIDAATLLQRFEVTRSEGLSPIAAKARVARYGPNLLPVSPARSSGEIFFQQFRSLPVALLGVSAGLSLLTGGAADALVISAVLLANAAIGFFTERHAERTIRALGTTASQHALVLRNGRAGAVDPAQVVPGDLLLLPPGTAVPADARLLEASHLTVDESALTGESIPVMKEAGALLGSAVPLAERLNMVYRGTTITGGSGLAIVTGTAGDTELGRIGALLGETQTPATPMQKQLDRLGNQLVLLSAPLCAAMFVTGLLRGYGALPMLKASMALFVAAIPEGLPTVATTIMSLGLREMQRQKVLVRRLNALEALGAVQVICLDKTGTLTGNRMTVMALACATRRYRVTAEGLVAHERRVAPDEDVRRLVTVAVLCNDAGCRDPGTSSGSATESALVELGFAVGLDVRALREMRPRLRTEYRTETRAYMKTVHRLDGGHHLVAVKGNPADVLALCRSQCVRGEAHAFSAAERDAVGTVNQEMARAGLRVLGLAYRFIDRPEEETRELTWLGLVGMADPVREGACEVIAELHKAGVSTVMITGDQSATAYAVGAQLKLNGNQPLEVLDASQLDAMDPDTLSVIAARVQVFARVSPSQKLKIVQALQRAGKVVAMTGDGINDGPALRCADVGVAMGRSGTEVARNVADIVLEDDELAAILPAIRHGRAAYDNIRKSIHFLLATNMSEIQVMVASTGLGLAPPLNPIQLLWINLISDILPALALALERPEPDVLRRPPRDPAVPIAALRDFKRLGSQAGMITAGTIGAYLAGLARHGAGPRASSAAFMTLTSGQLLHALAARSERYGIFIRDERLRPNGYLTAAIGASLAMQAGAGLLPPLRGLLGLAPLGVADWVVTAAGAMLPFFANEAGKCLPRSTRRSARARRAPAPSP